MSPHLLETCSETSCSSCYLILYLRIRQVASFLTIYTFAKKFLVVFLFFIFLNLEISQKIIIFNMGAVKWN